MALLDGDLRFVMGSIVHNHGLLLRNRYHETAAKYGFVNVHKQRSIRLSNEFGYLT
jgi:hypothetical protein